MDITYTPSNVQAYGRPGVLQLPIVQGQCSDRSPAAVAGAQEHGSSGAGRCVERGRTRAMGFCPAFDPFELLHGWFQGN